MICSCLNLFQIVEGQALDAPSSEATRAIQSSTATPGRDIQEDETLNANDSHINPPFESKDVVAISQIETNEADPIDLLDAQVCLHIIL